GRDLQTRFARPLACATDRHGRTRAESEKSLEAPSLRLFERRGGLGRNDERKPSGVPSMAHRAALPARCVEPGTRGRAVRNEIPLADTPGANRRAGHSPPPCGAG